ncbi:MAG: hypothetical protein K2M31_06215 [Muribaculaceae bacterium]|nr:hypothetical protein [Muribaculaceae bacterium]
MFEKYLDIYDNPESGYAGRYIARARENIDNISEYIKLDDESWFEARKINTKEAYLHYLELYSRPGGSYKGKHIDEAKEAIDSLVPPPPPDPRVKDAEAWDNAVRLNTIDAYNAYLKEFNPYGNSGYVGAHIPDAEEAIRSIQYEIDWKNAETSNTVKAYQEFIDKYSSGPYKKKAQQAIARIEHNEFKAQKNSDWKRALDENNPENYLNFIKKYGTSGKKDSSVPPPPPPDPRVKDAEAWDNAVRLNTIDAYNAYLKEFNPYGNSGYVGAHISEAEEAIYTLQHIISAQQQRAGERAFWQKAEFFNNIGFYKSYLYQYPSGEFRSKAEQAIAKLEYKQFLEQENRDWEKALKRHNAYEYRRFIAKYEAPGMKFSSPHLNDVKEKLKQRLRELELKKETEKQDKIETEATNNKPLKKGEPNNLGPDSPVQPPIPPSDIDTPLSPNSPKNTSKPLWGRRVAIGLLIFILLILAIIFILSIGSDPDPDPMPEVQTLQWAIDNKDIPMLRKYAELDSTRAYYPLAIELWVQNKDTLESLINIRKALDHCNSSGATYQECVIHLEVIKDALDYYNTIGHKSPTLSSDPDKRLLVLPNELAIIKRASYIAEKYDFEYTPDSKILQYIDDDFRRWVEAGDKTPVRATKEDCYKAALQLKDDPEVRVKLNNIRFDK